jgi:hypothetical protein
VNWCIVKGWVEAQVIDTKMVQIEQVFLSNVIVPDGHLTYERVRDDQFLGPPATEHESADGTTKTRH